MKRIIFFTLFIGYLSTIFGQKINEPNCYSNFDEYKNNTPSLTFNFQLKKRTDGSIFMTGGIANYRIKKVIPSTDTEKIEYTIWGVRVNGIDYINSYPYSKIDGYNKIEGKGYYSYFIGEPARTKTEQVELGIIKIDEKRIDVCCQTGYVILPTGKIMHLKPALLLELCQDDENIVNEIKESKLKIEDVLKMFEILRKYNLTKE